MLALEPNEKLAIYCPEFHRNQEVASKAAPIEKTKLTHLT
jgi:hypothetical protein